MKNSYEKEARERWGDEAVDRANQNVKNFSGEQKEMFENTFVRFGSLMHLSSSSEEVQKEVENWFTFLNENVSSYSLEAFQGLGVLYVEDERFRKNIDRHGEGLSSFLLEAMTIFVKGSKN